ncbi:Bug family tripartite tricarboxylate transporter substrate binding protein [Achromobacter aloeverae]|uniref:ABC transporter substrate-binding protein n=1 Tax=Achromobacter aloeverae TaxID=1750518 RepID=A0A4Q1HL77_9BURK|nr:tripartite tricarboxylate transporter substrate binding protein [Achromobacter aloeverae]RXN90248.1 ABC transporter substrate-binding protein [Achromobacter aloeverae]
MAISTISARLRQWSACAAILGAAAMGALPAPAQAWPDKPVTVIVPWPAGGPSDIAARPLSKYLSETLNQAFVIDNRAGASGNIGTGMVARAKPDGNTLLITASGPLVINQYLFKNMPFDARKDLMPITNLLRVPQVIVVNPSVPVNNLKELVDYIHDQKGNFSWASAGNGTTQHMTGELFKRTADLRMVHIPYKGSAPAITDLVGGHVAMLVDSTIAVVPMIKSGKAKAIAVTGKHRSPQLPDVPTVDESGYKGFESYAWYGLFAPANLPSDIAEKLNKTTLDFMKTPDFKRIMEETGSEFVGTDPATFASFIDEESSRWSKLAPSLNLTLD